MDLFLTGSDVSCMITPDVGNTYIRKVDIRTTRKECLHLKDTDVIPFTVSYLLGYHAKQLIAIIIELQTGF